MSFSPKNLKTKKIPYRYRNVSLIPVLFASIIFAVFLWSSHTLAATGINKQISFQGKVVNADGTNVSNGSYDFVFKLYTVSSGGAAVWTETRTGGSQVTVTDGIFQVDLGSVTTLPGSVDFNTDNIYLGIEFNNDGEMSPRVHFTAAPYAFNARTVGGLTVTDTTGTLTIPSGKTISFADAFTTSGAFATTLTATATTNVTLPTTGTLATLAGSESLTNKTIGSTGLVFSGATTDITTASGESLVITAAGAGTIDLQDATTVDSLTTDTGGISIAASQAYTGAGAVTLSSGGSSGLTIDSASGRVAVATGDFLSLSVSGVSGAAAGDIWYDSAANKFKINENGTTKILCNTTDAGCGGGGVTADSLDFIDLEDTLDLDAALTLNQTTNTWSQTFTGTTTTGLTYTANSLTSGSALAIASSSVAMTGSLESITLSGSNAANTGNLLLIADTGALNTTTPFKLTANGAATQVAALIENTGSGTALRINDEASDSTPFLIDADGNIAIGTTSVPAATKFTIQTNPWDATGDYRNLYNLAIYNSSTNNTGSIVNDYNQLDISGTGNKNNAIAGYNWLSHSSSGTLDSVGIGTSSYFYTTGGNVNEGIGERARINNAGSATILSGIAFDAMVDNTSTGTITSAYGLRVAMTNSGGGTVTTGYGIYLGDSTGTTDYGIYQAGSNDYNYFTGNTGFGDATPASLLTVGSGDAFQVNSSGAIVAAAGITSSGAITFSGFTSNGGVLYTNGSGVVAQVTAGTANQVLHGGTTPSFSAIVAADITADTFDFTEFEDTLDLDAALTLNQTTNTWSQSFTGDTGTGFTYTASSLTTGSALNIAATNAATTNTALSGASLSFTNNQTTTNNTNGIVGLAVNFSQNPSSSATGNTEYAFQVKNLATGDLDDTTVSALLRLDNGDTSIVGSTGVADAILISASGGMAATTAFSANWLNTPNIDITSAGAITGATGITSSGAIAANGGITFDNSSDTLGAFTLGGTVDANANILTNIGNTGTDFVASTGALTLAGVLTANGGITLSASQSISAAALAYIDLGSIVHNTTANQGLRLPNAASASPSAPTSGEGYLAWDAAGNQLITYDGSSWATLSGGSGYNLIKDESTSLTARTTLAFLGAGVSCADNASQTECTISGVGSSDLQTTYGNDADGSNVTISLTSADDGIVFSNPASSGTDSAFTFKVEQLNTGIDNDALYIDNRGTGDGLRIDDESGDTTPFIVDKDGRVGIQTNTSAEALQVGNETNRANISTYGDITSEGYDIQRSLSGIIDIFVYDTTRDSDGGEWRSSLVSQQMSWATETKDNTGADCVIGTDDRCGKSVFPRKAIIATTATGLHIFDGADNTLWMSFTQAGTYALGADTNNNPSGVGAQNGVIVVGTNGASATGMYTFDFKQDQMYRYNVTNRAQGDKNIGNRNSVVTYATDANTSMALIDTVVNDVSIAMITSSTEGMANTLTLPLDSATSPVRGMTLIAAATDTGISVVNMASRKTLNYSDATGNDYNQVVMTSRARLYATNETLAQMEEWRNMDRDVVAEVNGTPDRVYDETVGKSPITTGTVPTITTSPGSLAVIERASSARESAATTLLESGDIVFVGTNQGLAEIHTSGGNLVAASWSKLTTTTVATPYMNGAVRSVYLFDEAAGATTAASAIGAAGTTNNPMDSAVTGTAPTFGGAGVRGQSVNFNNNSYLCSDANGDGTCDADADFNAGTVSFTVSLWFKHSTTAAADTLFERCYTPATPTAAVGCIYAGMHTTGQIRFAIDSLTTWTYNTTYDDTILSTASYNDDQWHHAVFTNTDTDICMYIDGKQAVACDTAIAATATMDASQVLTIGGSCAGAACVTGANFWDGSIDDFTWDSNGGTTASGLSAQSATKMYLDGRAHLIRPSATVTDATAFSSTTIGDSGEAFVPGSFVGLVVELNGGTGSGQTRTIIANDATTFTVYPAFTVTPDATTDFRVNPAKLYGTSNNVVAIAPDLPTNLNKIRKVYVGTNDGADGGGVSVFTNAGTGSIKTEVIHSDAGYATDDFGSTWSGTDADDITAMSAYSDTIAIGSGAFQRAQRKEVSLKQLQLDMIGGFEDIRQELVSKQLFGSTQDVLGLGQGADLAERYYSNENLEAGEVVVIDSSQEAGVKQSSRAYQPDILGVVSTAPGLVLGPEERTPYPIALVGRVPVKVTNENGPIYAGDRLTSASRPGYAMRATQAGRVIGEALADAGDWILCDGENPQETGATLCTTVLVFVNLTDYSGQSVELAMAEREKQAGADGLSDTKDIDGAEQGLGSETASIRLATSMPTKQEKILDFLKDLDEKQKASGQVLSEVFTGRVAASREVITPTLYADQIFARSIKAGSIEGLDIFTDKIGSLEEKYAGLDATVTDSSATTQAVKEQLAIAMEKLSVETLSVNLDGSILGNLSVTGALQVGGAAEFGGETVFAKLVNFLGASVFKGMVSFEKAPIFASDTAGFAIIEKDARKVKIVFDTPYERQPIVTVTLTREVSPLLEDADEDLKQDIAILEEEYVGAVFNENIRYMVTEKSERGFTIVLSEKASQDLQFSWVALAVDKAKSFNSEPETGEKEPINDPAEEVVPVVGTQILPVEETVETPALPNEDIETRTSESTDASGVPLENDIP